MHAGASFWLLLWLLLTAGALFAMFLIHRGSHAHGELGSGDLHGHGGPSSEERQEAREEDSRGHEDEPASATVGR